MTTVGRDDWILRGLVQCGACGGLMLAVQQREQRRYACGRCSRFVDAVAVEAQAWQRFVETNEEAASAVPEQRREAIRTVVRRVIVDHADADRVRIQWQPR